MQKRRTTRQIHVGSVAIGGGAPVTAQTMTKTDTRDIDATVSQIHEVETLGCDIVRCAVVDESAANALLEIGRQVQIPIIADIHFNHKLALLALEAGVDGLRVNPGNIGGAENIRHVVEAARERKVPIRIGVNSGSLEEDLERKFGGSTPEALVESAMRHVRLLEDLDYCEIKLSVKASDVWRTVRAYRLLSQRTNYPLHLGVTEAGLLLSGAVRSSVALGILLAEGIGDTIRVSLTDTPAHEVRVGLEILQSLELRERGSCVVSCPTCGRVQVDVATVAEKVEQALTAHYREEPEASKPLVAVMGCMVNGPGEAKHADIALAGGDGKFALYVAGRHVSTVEEADAVAAVLAQARKWRPTP